MKKSFLAAALACVLSIGGFALFAQEGDAPQEKFSFNSTTGVLSSNGVETLKIHAKKSSGKINLSQYLKARAVTSNNKVFGYKVNGGDFVSLATLLSSIDSGDETMSLTVGTFGKDDAIQFGYAAADGKDFVNVGSDSGFHSGMDTDTFFKLDFSEAPFDGKIEILVSGEPLPSPVVTLLIAFAAGGILLLYNNRRKRAYSAEQA